MHRLVTQRPQELDQRPDQKSNPERRKIAEITGRGLALIIMKAAYPAIQARMILPVPLKLFGLNDPFEER